MATATSREIFSRYAHTDGYTFVSYNYDGSGLITGGNDSLVRVFKTSKTERNADAYTIEDHSEPLLAIAVHRENFALASEDGVVSIYKSSTNKFEKLLVRSTVPVRSLVYSSNGSRIAIACDEETIRIVLVSDISKVVSLTGHTKPVKSVAFDPLDDYLLSSGCEGDVRIWNINSIMGAPRCIHTIKNAIKSTQPGSDIMGTVAWKPDATCFAVPAPGHEICIYARRTWTLTMSLRGGHTDDIVTLAWSPNGRYICSAGLDNQLIIWDVEKKSAVRKYTSPVELSDVCWHPRENELAFTDRYGQLSVWDEPIKVEGTDRPHPAKRANNIDGELEKLFAEDDDDDTQETRPRGAAVLDEVEEEDDEEEDGDVEMRSELDDFVIDDDGAGYAEHPDTERHGRAHLPRGNNIVAQHHPRFQPGATKFRNMDPVSPDQPREGERRYLAFSMLCAVYTIFQGTHSVVNVEFHDQSQHRNFHFSDYNHYSMAALSEHGAVFAVEGGTSKPVMDEEEDDQDSTSSLIFYRPLRNWATDSEWTVHLPEGEDVQSVAINSTSVIAVTSKGYVRIFSLTGIQTHLFRLENIVATAGHGTLAMFVYSTGATVDGQYDLEVMLMDTDSHDILQKAKVPLQKGTELTWIGFSESSQAAIFDSNGMLSVLHRQRRSGQGVWVPVFDSKAVAAAKNRQERYWPIGMLRDRLMCIILRGSNDSPYFPRPPVSDVELQMPTVHMESEIGKLEERHLRESIVTAHEREEAAATGTEDEMFLVLSKADVEMDKALLQLMQIAVKADKQQRALDLVSALHMERSVDAAIKIATHHQKTSLAEKIMQIKEDKFMNHHLPQRRQGGYLDEDDGEEEDLLSSKRARN